MTKMIVSVTAALVVLAIASAAIAQAPASGKDWPQWLGPNRDGVSAEKGLTLPAGAKAAWTADIGNGYSSAAVVEGKLYTMGNANGQDTVWCLDAKTGKEIWKYSYACVAKGGGYPGPKCTPAVDGELVYTINTAGDMYCLDANGKSKWNVNVSKTYGVKAGNWEFATSPVVAGDLVIMDVGPTIALKKATGEKAWVSDKHSAGYSSPTVFKFKDKEYVASFPADGLVVMELATGKQVATYAWKTAYDVNAVTPLVIENKIFISSGYGTGCALVEFDGTSLKEVWKNKELSLHGMNAVLNSGYLYAVTGNYGDKGMLKCVELATGKRVWQTIGFPVGSVLLAGDTLFVLDGNGSLTTCAAAKTGFKQEAKETILSGQCWTMPVISGGRLYARNNKPGQLVCVELK